MAGAGRDVVVGRSAEREQLQAALAEAMAGTGQVVLVSGPAGIGKTRLVEQVAADADARAVPAAWGRCVADVGAPPLWPWRRVLGDDVLGTWTEDRPATPDVVAARRFRLMTTATDALTRSAAGSGLLVLLEDLHWADETSLALLRHLATEIRRSRVMVVATHRDPAGAVLQQVLPDLLTLPGVSSLPLAPLPPAGVAAYLTAVAGDVVDRRAVALLHERSGGNPLYLRSLVRVVGTDLLAGPLDVDAVERRVAASPELRHLVTALLRDLPTDVRHVLEIASLLGEDVDPPLLADVARLAPDDVLARVDAAAAAGILVAVPDAPGRLRFAHALVRDVVRGDLGSARSARLHLRAAEVLERAAAGAPDRASEVAFHWLRAATTPEQLRRAAHWARAAAARAGRLAPDDAAALLRSARTALDRAGADDAARAELLVELATAEYLAGRIRPSVDTCLAAADAAARAGRGDLQAEAALVVGGVGDPETSMRLVALCDAALVAGAAHPASVQARLLAQRAQSAGDLGRFAQAQSGATEALEMAERSGDRRALLAAIHARVNALDALTDPVERTVLADRALELLPSSADPLLRLWPHLWRLDALYMLGDPAAVTVEAQRIEALAASGPPLARWHLLRVQAARAAHAGRLDDARSRNADAGALAQRLQEPSAAGMTSAFRFCLAALTGDPAELGDGWLTELRGAPDLPVIAANRANALLLLGRTDEAAGELRRVVALVPELPRDARWHATLYALVDVAVALPDLDAAAQLRAQLLPSARWCGGPGSGNMWMPGSGWHPVGRLAAVLGERAEAARMLRDALEVDARIGAVSNGVLARVDLADVLADDDPAVARDLARQAAHDARRIGLRAPYERADRLLRRLSTSTVDPLTAREREVAGLVAQSLSNREIADRLVLSERTVETHVRSILAKLGLRRRTDVVLRWTSSGRA